MVIESLHLILMELLFSVISFKVRSRYEMFNLYALLVVAFLLTAYIILLLENRANETNYPCHNEVFLNDYLYLKVFCAKIDTNEMCQNPSS